MIKGWCTGKGEAAKEIDSPDAANGGDIYYFDKKNGTMAKGIVNIDGKIYCFDSITGILQKDTKEVLTNWYRCGDNSAYLYDINGDSIGDKLVISGTGAIYNYKDHLPYQIARDMPWVNEENNIKILVIEEGITSIGKGPEY